MFKEANEQWNKHIFVLLNASEIWLLKIFLLPELMWCSRNGWWLSYVTNIGGYESPFTAHGNELLQRAKWYRLIKLSSKAWGQMTSLKWSVGPHEWLSLLEICLQRQSAINSFECKTARKLYFTCSNFLFPGTSLLLLFTFAIILTCHLQIFWTLSSSCDCCENSETH